MEKLLKALNEYEGKDIRYDEDGELHNKCNYDVLDSRGDKLLLISKEYGFIKRLVERSKLSFIEGDFKGRHFKGDDYEDMIMLLSIHDEPITMLASFISK